ncbi:MAG: acetate/propionate family kinase [Polyangiales bacterium]
MRVLVLNSGSSSIKYELFEMTDRTLLAGGAAERIGDEGGRLVHGRRARDGAFHKEVTNVDLSGHAEALDRIVDQLSVDTEPGGELGAIGHRVVHGGEAFREPCLIDVSVIETIRELSPLAPLHNPANLLCIEVSMARQPGVPQVAVFDTAFHQTIPPRAYRYAVPERWYESFGVRRYGFHGTSHAYVAKQAARYLGRPLDELNLIVLHLGNGASATAIAKGKSVDTSMGLTPLEGLVMGTRSGDLDPGVVLHLAREAGLSIDEIDADLNGQSGLEGLCGVSDMRDALEREAAGDARAKLGLDVYTYRIRKYIGAFMAALGRVDGIVFTAGVGENSPEIRARACTGLEGLGIELDEAGNQASGEGARAIHRDTVSIPVLVIPTDEELEIAEQTLACVER